VDDCTLRVAKGEIYGVIGASGAGKSTLVRLINRLETPDSGTVTVGGQNLAALDTRALRLRRQKIGMIFQHFNLLHAATVFDNVAAPLRNIGLSKAETADRVDALLSRVGLTDKRDAYPGQLSGGQKQRVAIARALSCNPDVLLCDEATSALDTRALRLRRQKIGMIFQHFNLLHAATVFDNVAAPLRNIGLSKTETADRVDALLSRVGLTDKRDAYPGQLSGGQKQRVAIARALSCNPDVLLCDEATSALDVTTTHQILGLIADIAAERQLTVVVIAHQMEVIRAICHRVAVMDGGKIVEDGDIVSVFTRPEAATTRAFINQSDPDSRYAPDGWTRPLYRLSFVGESAERPVIAQMMRDYGVTPNILRGNIQTLAGTPFGTLMLDIAGENRDAAIDFLKRKGVGVERVGPKPRENYDGKGGVTHA
jgi:D-methionine transport system ATP-binding protein